MNSFGYWLQEEMNKQRLTQRELARLSKVSQGSIGNVIRGDRDPGPALCNAIAPILKLEPEVVFRTAKLLPPLPPDDESSEDLILKIKRMPQARRKQVEDFVIVINERYERETAFTEIEKSDR
jgi:transcriptional regulator with XRE-family HTH domain